MPKVVQPGDYFVVGGPVQADRACYVERAADAALARGIAEQRFCYVLAARATGKSSLMARAIRSLRQDRQLAAVVDLSQIGVRGDSGEATRWYYGIAYRVLRELRLKFDLQGWWQEKNALSGEQRLAEFFWEVVLTHTSVPVTIFIDEIERTLALPFAQDLFATIHTCYARRVSEPEYSRLNFVVLGVAAPAELCADAGLSPFIDGLSIEPADFTLEQSRELAVGFDAGTEAGHRLIERIHAWSGGQPYLTQRIARGVARKGGRLEDVDRVVREQFLAPGAAEKDPYLNRIRMLLTRRGVRPSQALALLGKIARGVPVDDVPRSAAKDWLRLAGVTSRGEDGVLRYRNRILREVFDERWIAALRPFAWRRAGAIAATVAAAVLVPLWYSQVLPRPYIDTLTVVEPDFAVAEEAHEKLRRLPGFAERADLLLAGAMTRRSRNADSHAEMAAADQVLRRKAGQGELADRLEAEYWLRRAAAAMHAEKRDEAVLLALESLPAGGADARRLLAELIGDDLVRLRETLRLGGRPSAWAVDFDAGTVSVVDGSQRARRLALDAEQSDGRAETLRLASFQHVPVQRELSVDEHGVAGTFRLNARIRHERPEDLLLELTAPDGNDARFPLDARGGGEQVYSFEAADGTPLALLTDADRRGVWRLTVVDQRAGISGTLIDWSLSFTGARWPWRDAPPQGHPIPDPTRTEQVEITVSDDGRLAAARPSRRGAVGALAIWDLAEGGLRHVIELPVPAERVAFTPDASRLLVQTADAFSVFDPDSGRRIARIAAPNGFTLPPAQSVDGSFVVLAEPAGVFGEAGRSGVDRVAAARLHDAGDATLWRASLIRTADGSRVAFTTLADGAHAWVLGPQARYAAVVEATARLVSIIDPRRGGVERRLHHERDVRRLLPVPSGDWLLSVDTIGDVRAWRLPVDASRPGLLQTFRLGTTVDPDSVSVSADGSLVAYAAAHGALVVRELAEDARAVHVRTGPDRDRVETRLGPDGRTLVTAHGDRLQVWDMETRGAGQAADPDVTALAIDADGAVTALGFRGGHVRVRSVAELSQAATRTDAIDYIGHRGRVTSLAINARRALIASGGGNGLVRVWDLASVAPTAHFLRHPAGPVEAVALSPDGRWVASAAEYFARLWQTHDGEQAGELTVNGTALSIAFAPDSSRWAVGDSSGNVFVALPDASAILGSVRTQGPVHAIAFAPDGRFFVSGGAGGHVELWDAASFAASGESAVFAHPVRWIGFAGSASDLLIQTDRFLHRARIDDARIRVVASRLLPAGVAAGAARSPAGDGAVRVARGLGAGALAAHDLPLDAFGIEPLPEGTPLLTRDWSRALGLEIASNGAVVAVSR